MPKPRRLATRRLTGLMILLVVILGHLLIGMGLLLRPTPTPETAPAGGPLLISLLADEPDLKAARASRAKAHAHTPPPAPSPEALPDTATPEAAAPQEEVADLPAEPSAPTPVWTLGVNEPCDVLGVVQARLQQDASAIAALGALPNRARSVANAVMLWDGAWRQDGPPRPLADLRLALGRALAGAPPTCLDAANAGPRLIMLQDGGGTALLAVGSGAWTWSQMLAGASPKVIAAK